MDIRFIEFGRGLQLFTDPFPLVADSFRPEDVERLTDEEACDEIRRAMIQSPTVQWFCRLGVFATSAAVFDGNLKELEKELHSFEAVNGTSWEEGGEHLDELTAHIIEITRTLHNFLASAKTLTDHTRALQLEMGKKGKNIQEYGGRVKRSFDDSTLQHFVKDLRNYMLHYRCPDFNLINDPREGSNPRQLVSFQKTNLLEWDGWNVKSRSFIQSLEEDTPILAVMTEYAAIVHDFNHWLLEEIVKVSDNEFTMLERYSRILEKLNENGSK